MNYTYTCPFHVVPKARVMRFSILDKPLPYLRGNFLRSFRSPNSHSPSPIVTSTCISQLTKDIYMQNIHTETNNKMASEEYLDNIVVPLQNLSEISTRMDSLHNFISQSIITNTLLPNQHIHTLSNELFSTIRHVIANATALVAACPPVSKNLREDIVELDAVKLLAKHSHFCKICGKGFTRDANVRMHMRAHGEQFKTPEALAAKKKKKKPREETRFSCPYEGCKRNKLHTKFRSLKSVFCLKNHFKRSHCPKTHTCDRCNKKSFAVLSDLKSHAKQCRGESTWKCSCGTTFSRKERLFGHVALFEGHLPAADGEGVGAGAGAMLTKESDGLDELPEGFFDNLENFGFDSF